MTDDHANDADLSDEDCAGVETPEGALVREMVICNKKGLHARATAKFVQTVTRFSSEITVGRCGESVGGTSIMGILTLGAGYGSTITVSARGDDAQAALDALETLVADRFGEGE